MHTILSTGIKKNYFQIMTISKRSFLEVKKGNIMTHAYQFSIAYIHFYLKKKEKKEKIQCPANKLKLLACFIHIKTMFQVG